MQPISEKRPWGSYTILLDTPTHKVKQIEVLPKGKLSLQSHAQRSEVWAIVSGVGYITIGETTREYAVGDVAVIPVTERHRIENRGTSPVIFIEVQTGTYFGEDDIIRYDDEYGRA